MNEALRAEYVGTIMLGGSKSGGKAMVLDLPVDTDTSAFEGKIVTISIAEPEESEPPVESKAQKLLRLVGVGDVLYSNGEPLVVVEAPFNDPDPHIKCYDGSSQVTATLSSPLLERCDWRPHYGVIFADGRGGVRALEWGFPTTGYPPFLWQVVAYDEEAPEFHSCSSLAAAQQQLAAQMLETGPEWKRVA